MTTSAFYRAGGCLEKRRLRMRRGSSVPLTQKNAMADDHRAPHWRASRDALLRVKAANQNNGRAGISMTRKSVPKANHRLVSQLDDDLAIGIAFVLEDGGPPNAGHRIPAPNVDHRPAAKAGYFKKRSRRAPPRSP